MKTLLLALLLALPAQATEPDTVILGLDEFLTMYDASKPVDDPVQAPPRDFTLSAAHYDGVVVEENGEPVSALFTATLRVDVLKDEGWSRIPLVPSTVALRRATVAGRTATVVPDGQWLTLVTERRGSFDVQLEFATSIDSAEGRTWLGFELAPSGATTASLAVPAPDALAFTVDHAELTTHRVDGDLRVVEAVLPGTGWMSVSWQRALPEAATDDARLVAEVFTLAALGEGLLTERTTIAWTILQSGVEQLQVAVPEGVTVVEAEGAGVRTWAVADGVLTVSLNYAAEGAWSLVVRSEQRLPAGTVTVPLLEPLGVERRKGWVGIEARGAVEIEDAGAKGLTPVDVRLLPASILGVTDQPVLLGWKYLGEGASLPLSVVHHEDVDVLVTLLDTARATTMFTPDGRRLTEVAWRVRNNRKQFLRLRLPAGAELWSAAVGGKAVQPAKGADGRVLLPLLRSQSGSGALADFEVSVVYVESGVAPVGGKGSFRASLPGADVPTTYVSWTVYAPDEAKIRRRSLDGSLRAVDHLSQPFSQQDQLNIAAVTRNQVAQVQTGADGQVAHGGLGDGAAPVAVRLPLEGTPMHFEKLLALGEELWVSFDYRGLK